ncbi:MAG TPA: ABC transporter permease [Caldilineaceae bacterium]|mgnify:CR=1 FL=1|nr:ABC transporter permease [Caldilineaceae bacterium]HRW04432.1 ABC transporter permease [Caldilineaceae bacterium]
MGQYIARRLLALIPVLIGVSLIVFLLIRMIPGDPVIIMLGERARPEDIERVREEMGFNRPVYVQYVEWMGRILRGDLGTSIINRTEVMDELKYRLSATVEMIVVGMIIGLAIGISIGIISALRRNTWIDLVATAGALLGVSMPIYWLALILVYALAVNRQIFPPSARLDVDLTVVRHTGFMLIDTLLMGDIRLFFNALWHLALPSFVLSTVIMPILARLTRASMLEVMRQDYVRTAEAKGLTRSVVITRHALKNALLPIVTVVGLQLGGLLGGALLTETIFSWPGMGLWTYRAILSRDYPIVQGAVLVSAVIYVVVNLLVDISYAYLDPRIRYSD